MTRQLVLALAIASITTACGERTSLPRTNPKTWSNGGWQQFRWGMGPGDVELVVRKADGDLRTLRVERLAPLEAYHGSPDTSWTELPGDAFLSMAGRRCKVRFGFYKSALFRIALYSEFNGEFAITEQSRLAWRDKVAALVREKYGNPTAVEEARGWRTMEWKTESTSIWVEAIDSFKPDTKLAAVGFGYADPIRAKLADDFDPADKNKL